MFVQIAGTDSALIDLQLTKEQFQSELEALGITSRDDTGEWFTWMDYNQDGSVSLTLCTATSCWSGVASLQSTCLLHVPVWSRVQFSARVIDENGTVVFPIGQFFVILPQQTISAYDLWLRYYIRLGMLTAAFGALVCFQPHGIAV